MFSQLFSLLYLSYVAVVTTPVKQGLYRLMFGHQLVNQAVYTDPRQSFTKFWQYYKLDV